MAAQQSELRKQMQQMMDQLKADGGNGSALQKIIDKMEMQEDDIVNSRITSETLERQKEIETRLLQAEKAMMELDLDLSGHHSKPLTPELVNRADLIVAMTEGHRFHILQEFPEVGNKVCLIKSFGTSKVPADISDPFGGSLNIYRKTRDEIDRALSDLILFIRTGKH